VVLGKRNDGRNEHHTVMCVRPPGLAKTFLLINITDVPGLSKVVYLAACTWLCMRQIVDDEQVAC
jgi:hypothetical protein